MALAEQAILPVRRHFSIAWSVACHIRALYPAKTVWHWQVHLWGPVTHCVRWGSLERGFVARTPSQNMQ